MSRIELLSQASKIKETLSSNNSSLEGTITMDTSNIDQESLNRILGASIGLIHGTLFGEEEEPIQQNITNTYRTFNGCDIVATFNGREIGRLDSIDYIVRRGE